MRAKSFLKYSCFALFLVIYNPLALRAQTEIARFESIETMIPMRDGVRLYTEVHKPQSTSVALPILLLRTPHGVEGWAARAFTNYLKELAEERYIFVFQDIRGRCKSEGQFVMMRPPRDPHDPKAIDESTDAYDTIAWLLKNISNHNGRAGALGISYGGWARGEGSTLGRIAFENASARHFREKIQAPWFAYFLQDKGKLDFPEAQTFRMGANQWVSHEHWPPRKNSAARKLYFHANRKLSFDPPNQDNPEQHDSYISDPANPVPYATAPSSRPIIPQAPVGTPG